MARTIRKTALIHAASLVLGELAAEAPEGAFADALRAAMRHAHEAWKIAAAEEDAAKAAPARLPPLDAITNAHQ